MLDNDMENSEYEEKKKRAQRTTRRTKGKEFFTVHNLWVQITCTARAIRLTYYIESYCR